MCVPITVRGIDHQDIARQRLADLRTWPYSRTRGPAPRRPYAGSPGVPACPPTLRMRPCGHWPGVLSAPWRMAFTSPLAHLDHRFDVEQAAQQMRSRPAPARCGVHIPCCPARRRAADRRPCEFNGSQRGLQARSPRFPPRPALESQVPVKARDCPARRPARRIPARPAAPY